MTNFIRAMLTFVLLVGLVPTGFVSVAQAGQSCKNGYYFDTGKSTCVKKVKITIKAQDAAASGGPQWGPPNRANCNAASREMDQSAALCRSYDGLKAYDAKLGIIVKGKVLEQCAKCCRQLREGMARWKLCYKKGLAPRPDFATANKSAKKLNCSFRF